LPDSFIVAQEETLGDLQHDTGRWNSGLVEEPVDRGNETGRTELSRRHVDADKRRLDGRTGRPFAGGVHGRCEHPLADHRDETGFLGHIDELVRRQPAASGVLPSQKRLETDRFGIRQRHDRLVFQEKRVIVNRTFKR
jgi:hypothetical protein